MTDTTNLNREQAREVLARACASAWDGREVNAKTAGWQIPVDDAIAAMLEFAALPTPEAERVERNEAFDRGYLAGLKTAGWHVERNHPAAAKTIFARVAVIQEVRPSNDPAAGSAGEVERLMAMLDVWHRHTCYPDAQDFELREAAKAIIALHPTQDSRDVTGAEAKGGVAQAIALVRRIAARESWQSHYGKRWEEEAAEIVVAIDAGIDFAGARAALDLHTTEGEA